VRKKKSMVFGGREGPIKKSVGSSDQVQNESIEKDGRRLLEKKKSAIRGDKSDHVSIVCQEREAVAGNLSFWKRDQQKEQKSKRGF